MNGIRIFLCLAPLVSLFGCSTVSTQQARPADYSAVQVEFDFGEVDINTALSAEIVWPSKIRVGVVPLRGDTYSTSFHYAGSASSNISHAAYAPLREVRQIYDASPIPRMLIDDVRNLDELRRVSARYQADVLLVYRAECRQDGKFRLFDSNIGDAACVVDAMLLDVRTGLVPFGSQSIKSMRTEQSESDLNYSQTRARAQREALDGALSDIGKDLAAFLTSAPFYR